PLDFSEELSQQNMDSTAEMMGFLIFRKFPYPAVDLPAEHGHVNCSVSHRQRNKPCSCVCQDVFSNELSQWCFVGKIHLKRPEESCRDSDNKQPGQAGIALHECACSGAGFTAGL